MLAAVTSRPIEPTDLEFLYQVYASTRQEELAPVPWTEEEKESFLRMQFNAQHQHYQDNYGAAQFCILERSGSRIGRLYVDRRDDEIRLIDIALLPEYRKSGIGRALIEEILAEAATAAKPVRIHVEQMNPALRLYKRLGFRHIEENGVYYLMEWSPVPVPD